MQSRFSALTKGFFLDWFGFKTQFCVLQLKGWIALLYFKVKNVLYLYYIIYIILFMIKNAYYPLR